MQAGTRQADPAPRSTAPAVAPGTLAAVPQPVLTVDEIVLRPRADRDVPLLVTAYQDPAIRRWHTRILTTAEAYVPAANRAWVQETAANWAVTDGTRVLGRMSVNTLDLAEASGRWATGCSRQRGRAVATRALVAVTGWALGDLGMHRLEVEHSTANTASCRVAAAGGYPLESTRRSSARHDDGWHDMHPHAVVAAPAADLAGGRQGHQPRSRHSGRWGRSAPIVVSPPCPG